MNKANKVKVMLFAILGFIVVVIVLAVFLAINKGSDSTVSVGKNDTISVSNNDKFTYQDMMTLNETKQEEYTYEPPTTQGQRPSEALAESKAGSDAQAGGSASQSEVKMKQIAARINQPQPSQEEEQPSEVKTPKTESRMPKTVTNPSGRKPLANAKPEEEPEMPSKRKLFFDSDNEESRAAEGATTISAVVHGDQLVDNNTSVKFHTTIDARINGTLIPRNTVFYGVASNATNRIKINVTSISGIPVSFQVYDQGDGMEGLRIARQTNASIDAVQNDAISTAGLYSVPVVGGLTRAASNLIRSRRTNTSVVLSTNYKVSVR